MGGGYNFPQLHASGGTLCAASGEETGRCIPESVFREKLESLDIRVKGVTQLRSGLREQDPQRPLFHTLLHRTGGARA